MSILDFPAQRKTINSLGNPVFVDDIVICNENLLAAINAIIGEASGFYILSGFSYAYTHWTPGIFWADGIIYYSNANVNVNKYLNPSPTNKLVRKFSDTNSYPTYSVNYAVQSNSQYLTWPIFDTDTNVEKLRLNLSNLKSHLSTAETNIATLQSDVNFAETNITDLQNLKANKTQENWINMTLKGDWKSVNGDIAQYMKDDFGFVHLRGSVYLSSTDASTDEIWDIPTGYKITNSQFLFFVQSARNATTGAFSADYKAGILYVTRIVSDRLQRAEAGHGNNSEICLAGITYATN